MYFKVMTVREQITPSQKPFRSLVDVDLLGQAAALGATHVLVGIDWGAMGTITCEDENKDGEETTRVKGALKAELQQFDTWKNKILQVRSLKDCGIIYMGRNGDLFWTKMPL